MGYGREQRGDGTNILLRSRLKILHDAILAHCSTLSGVQHGLLEDPLACKFDASWMSCAAGADATSTSLTAEEGGVVQKFYAGPSDGAGHYFEPSGFAAGSELARNVPSAATTTQRGPGGGGMSSTSIKYLLLPTVGSDEVVSQLAFNMEWFNKISVMAPLWNAANTDLKPFEAHGGKLLMWHGLADTSVEPATSVAYYQGVQKTLGEKQRTPSCGSSCSPASAIAAAAVSCKSTFLLR